MAKHNKAWFRSTRGSYLPRAWQGIVIYLLYVAYIGIVPVIWYRSGHTLWQLIVYVIPDVVAALLVTQLIASKHAR